MNLYFTFYIKHLRKALFWSVFSLLLLLLVQYFAVPHIAFAGEEGRGCTYDNGETNWFGHACDSDAPFCIQGHCRVKQNGPPDGACGENADCTTNTCEDHICIDPQPSQCSDITQVNGKWTSTYHCHFTCVSSQNSIEYISDNEPGGYNLVQKCNTNEACTNEGNSYYCKSAVTPSTSPIPATIDTCSTTNNYTDTSGNPHWSCRTACNSSEVLDPQNGQTDYRCDLSGPNYVCCAQKPVPVSTTTTLTPAPSEKAGDGTPIIVSKSPANSSPIEPSVKCNGAAPNNQTCGSISAYPAASECPGNNWGYTAEGNAWCSWKYNNAATNQYCYTCSPVVTTGTPTPTPTPPSQPGYCANSGGGSATAVGTPPAGCYIGNSTWDGQTPNPYCNSKNIQTPYFFYCTSGTPTAPGSGGGSEIITPGSNATITVTPATSYTGPASGPCAGSKGGVASYWGPLCGEEAYNSAKAASGYFCTKTYTDKYICNNKDTSGNPIVDLVPSTTNACAQTPWCINNGTPLPTVGANTPTPTLDYRVECPSDGNHICAATTSCDGTAGYSVHQAGNQVCNEFTGGAKPYCCSK
jgi:hypothetical protein